MKKLILIYSLLTALAGFAQKKTPAIPDAFYACWAASYEENKEDSQEKLYRPCSHQFPPSRFRQNVTFNKGGTCKVLQVGEADAHYMVDCKWTYDKKKKIISVADDKKKVNMKFKLVSVDKESLKIIFIE